MDSALNVQNVLGVHVGTPFSYVQGKPHPRTPRVKVARKALAGTAGFGVHGGGGPASLAHLAHLVRAKGPRGASQEFFSSWIWSGWWGCACKPCTPCTPDKTQTPRRSGHNFFFLPLFFFVMNVSAREIFLFLVDCNGRFKLASVFYNCSRCQHCWLYYSCV